MNPEQGRILSAYEPNREGPTWLTWGPYLSDRAWATVREDYSANGDAWEFFPHEHARSKAYRWNEDGLGGISDDRQILCFAFALWNGKDAMLKERFFGVTGPQGNHGEDVKEVYFYLESTPSHSLLGMNYKYPQAAYPYADLVATSQKRTRLEPEYELPDTGVFAENRFFDIDIAYAKASPTDLHIEVTATNRGPEAAPLHLLPTLWFRNTWSWGRAAVRPQINLREDGGRRWLEAVSAGLGTHRLYFDPAAEALFTENETNEPKLYGTARPGGFFKDGIGECVVNGKQETVNPARQGTKAAVHHAIVLAPGERRVFRLRLTEAALPAGVDPFLDAETLFAQRRAEADLFFRSIEPAQATDDERRIHRQALAGMLWSKQFYHFVVRDWLTGDPGYPPPPFERQLGRNAEWKHLYNDRVMSMPDTWEYPWYASWDLAFHCIALVLADPDFAKGQLDLLVREWYQHPNGQMPAYEWNFGDVNPPVFAWAAWRVYKIEERRNQLHGLRGGKGDRAFLESMFHKLLLNFTWWVNRKDSEGKNIFQGGFLGLDNIGVFDRSKPLPTGGYLEQSDATSWMGMFCLNMMKIALELALENPVYENIATKFFEHFLSIAEAMNTLSGHGIGLWDEQDQFFYDMLNLPDGTVKPLRVRSLVGLMPLLAVETMEPEELAQVPGFTKRLEWYLAHRPDLAALISRWQTPGKNYRRLIALVRGHRMKCLLRRMLDPAEFLSDHGIRSLSQYHRDHPYLFKHDHTESVVTYEPGESQTYLFGGNSNWRGPVWFPINYLLIESLQKFHHYYGDDFKVECPTGSGTFLTLCEVADEISRRLIGLFQQQGDGGRAYMGPAREFLKSVGAGDQLLFHEYFHGETGAGLGAAHQTGWTGLVAKLVVQQAAKRDPAATGEICRDASQARVPAPGKLI